MKRAFTVFLILIASIAMAACVTQLEVKKSSKEGLSFKLKNKTDKIAYYMIDWMDCDFAELPGQPCNVAGGELPAGETRVIDSEYKLGTYRIRWRNHKFQDVKIIQETYQKPQWVVSVLDSQERIHQLPDGRVYKNDGPVDPYDMLEWERPEDGCLIANAENELVYACLFINPDQYSDYPGGIIGFRLTPDGSAATKLIVIYAVVDKTDYQHTYRLNEKTLIYTFERKDYIGGPEGRHARRLFDE